MEDDNKTGSLIPDPTPSTDAGGSSDLPVASIIPSEDTATTPAETSLMNDTGSLVPDETVMIAHDDSTAAPSAPAASESAPKEQSKDDSYTVPPEPDLPVAGAIKNDDQKTEKKPINKKLIGIIAGSVAGVAVLTLLIIFVIVPLIANLTRGSLDTEAKSFFVREKLDDGNYAVFSEEGKPLTGFVYGSATDFVKGYALVTDEAGEKFGIMSAGGKMSVDFGIYTKIQQYGALYDVATENGGHKLISGDNTTVAEYGGTIERLDANGTFLFLKDDKYFFYDANGEKLLEFDSSDKPEIEFEKNSIAYSVRGKKHVYIMNVNTNEIFFEQETGSTMDIRSYSEDFACVLLQDAKDKNKYGVKYNGEYKELESSASISIENAGYISKDGGVRQKTSCYFYTDDNSSGSYDTGYYHPNYTMMDTSFNFIAVPAYRTKEGNKSINFARIDPTHFAKIANDTKAEDYTIQFYSDGKVTNTVRSLSSISYYKSVIDGKYYFSISQEQAGSTYGTYVYNSYDRDGKLLSSGKEQNNIPQDIYGNRISSGYKSVIYDKDFNVKYEGSFDYNAVTDLNGKYFINNKTYKFIIDPESGKELIPDNVYKELTYSQQYNIYLGVRDDGTADAIDGEFNTVGSFSGKTTLKQNHVAVRGGSVTELYTLKGEKFYTYE